jgi:hypothetical protein
VAVLTLGVYPGPVLEYVQDAVLQLPEPIRGVGP